MGNRAKPRPGSTPGAPDRRVVLVNKPWGVLCQFTSADGRPTLAGLCAIPGVYPAGRLDADSEGLVVLTDDGALQAAIADPHHRLAKTYVVQVEGCPDEVALSRLRSGIVLADGPTRPATVRRIDEPTGLWPRTPPVRFRRSIPTSWLEITITEGRNRQVRRMTAAVGSPTLRLVRWRVGPWSLDGLPPGHWREEPVPARVLSSAAAANPDPLPARAPPRSAAPRRPRRPR